MSVLLDDLDITVEQAATGAGLSRASVYRKLTGESAWKAADIDAMARFLKVQPGDLFAGDPALSRRAGTV